MQAEYDTAWCQASGKTENSADGLIRERCAFNFGSDFNFGEGQVVWNGGASRDRTDDLIVANDALSQLSYSPVMNP
jgi:hypothetical protein